MRQAPLLVPLSVLLLLAGCLDPQTAAQPEDPAIGSGAEEAPDGPGPEEDGPAPAPEGERRTSLDSEQVAPIEVHSMPFHLDVDGGKSTVANLLQPDPRLDLDLSGATAVILELAWDSDVFDLDPWLIFLDGCSEGEDLQAMVDCTPSEAEDHWLGEDDDGNYWVKDGSIGAPDSPVRLEITQAALQAFGCEGSCSAFARAIVKEAAVDVDGELVVSVFRGVPVPDGYSALAA